MKTKTITTISLFTALLCVVSPFIIPLPITPVPLSLATLILYFTANLLGHKKALLCCLIYFLIGLAGIPVFSGFSSGISKLAGPTGGYLIGYFFIAFFAGIFAKKAILLQLFGMIIGSICLYFFGTVWLSFLTHTTLLQSALSAVVPFLPGDILKIIIAIVVCRVIKKYVAKAQISFT